jgi:pullulanase/glycogen debranching enzyme
MVTANMCRKEGDPPKDDPPYSAYGIDIGPDCSNIAVTNNDFRNAGKSGSMDDNGVGTITTPSNIVQSICRHIATCRHDPMASKFVAWSRSY